MRLTILLLFISICSFGQSTFHGLLTDGGNNLFVSLAGAGSESGLNESNPMAFTDFLGETISAGTTIYFNRGDTYNLEDYDFTVDAEITVFGSGADPVFYGSDDISGLTYTHDGGGIYFTPMATEPKWVWIAGECAKNAETARITVSSRGSTTTATVPNATLDSYTDLVGAYLVIKEKNFQNSQRVSITNYNSTTNVVTFDGVIPDTDNVDLVVYNDVEFFDDDNEWVWRDDTLWVKAAANPSTLDIRASDATYGIKTTANLTVKNAEFHDYYTAAIWLDGGIPIIDECSFHDIRDVAILVQRGGTGVSVTDSDFLRIGNVGVYMRPVTDSYVLRNTFTDIGMQDNYNWQTWFDGDGSIRINNISNGGIAILHTVDLDDDTLDGGNLTMEYNVITNVAYNGVSCHMGSNNVIKYNIVTNAMQRYDDGGAIYIHHYRAYDEIQDDTEIGYNIVELNSSSVGEGLFKIGVYCDNSTRGTFVHHNTVNTFDWGILLNRSTSDHTVEDNNIINCTYGVVWRVGSINANPNIPTNINNQFNRNVIVSLTADQKSLWFNVNSGSFPGWNPYSGTGGADNNVYDKNAGPGGSLIADSDIFTDDMTFTDLQTDYGEDASSVKLVYNGVLVTNPTNAISNEDAQSDYKDAAGSTLTTYTIDPYYSRIIYEINYSNTLVAASTQYFDAGTTTDVQFTHTSTFSISIRFKLPANPTPGNYQLISNLNGSLRGVSIVVNTSGFVAVTLINTSGTNQINFVDNVDVADNAWHHLLFVKTATASASEMYIDGADASPAASGTLSATIASTENWNIGRRPNGTLYYDGLIDDVAIWDSPVTLNRLFIYNGGRQINFNTIGINKPIHYWRMGKAGSLVDVGRSASLLNLTAVNSPTNSTDAP